MQLAHAGDDQLAGLFIGEALEGRIFFSQTLQTLRHLILVGLRLRLDGHADDWLREGRGLEGDVEVLVAKGIAGGDVAQTDQGCDVAGVDGIDIFAFAALNDHQTAHTFTLTGARIVDRITLFELSGIDTEENQLTGVRVGPKLERERAELAVVVRRNWDSVFGVFGVGHHACGRRDVQRGRQVIDDGVDQDLNALFLESGAAKDRDELDQAGEAADRSLKNGNRNGFLFENELRDCIVLVGYGIDEFGQRRFRAILVSGRNLGDFVLQAFVGEVALAPNDGLLVDHVDDAGEFVFSSDVQEDRERIGTELFAHVGQRVVKIGTGAVHLVDERDPGHFVLGGLAPDRLGLGLDTGYTAKHSDRAV